MSADLGYSKQGLRTLAVLALAISFSANSIRPLPNAEFGRWPMGLRSAAFLTAITGPESREYAE
jgi:hypothetical protein